MLAWLKSRGIHATSTAGESPAGNRAEVAVQALKGSTRKLLNIAGLPRHFWPVALLHASSRNWALFSEALGVPQPPLLPFGQPVQARKRTKTGYDAQFQLRTMPGKYLGLATNTPGGHLVLIEVEGSSKILLTNTVYPVRGSGPSAPRKPRYRLIGKRSPDFEVRVAAAAMLELGFDWESGAVLASKLGGGSFLNSSTVGSVFEDRVESGGEDSEGSSSESLHGWDGQGLKEHGCVERKVWIEDVEVKERAESKLLQGFFDDASCLDLLRKGPGGFQPATRPLCRKRGQAVLFGLYGVGGFHGISNASEGCPSLVKYLNGYLASLAPQHVWTTLYVSKNVRAPIHRDLRNAGGFCTCVKALGEFQGGGLWIESDDGSGLVGKTLPNGDLKIGNIHDVKGAPVLFLPTRWHVAEDWQGDDRWVISAFVPRDYQGTSEEQWSQLRSLGFPVDGVLSRAAELLNQSTGNEESLKSSAGEVGGLKATVQAAYPSFEWVVELPVPVWDEGLHQGWLKWHDATARLCRFWAEELCETLDCPESILGVSEQLCMAEQTAELLEWGLAQEGEGKGVLLKALEVEVPLSAAGNAEDQFLQTRTIGLAEARREIGCWKEPALEEVTSLEVTNEAVVRISVSQVDQWVEQGIAVIQLPGKCVLTRKSGTGRRRCRAVCCGNYLPADKLGLSREDLYASGAEGVTLRVALAFAARYVTWKGFTIDVKSAFLYAPIGAEAQGREERIVVKPPSFLTELGILKGTDRWWVKKALYGLPTSPKDWGNYRDQEFRALRLLCGERQYGLVQSKADESLWFLREIVGQEQREVVGLLVVYVDDLAVFAELDLCEAFIKAVQLKWKTSSPSWFGLDPITFCGVEIVLSERGYRLAQTAYLQELLQRFQVGGTALVPMTRWVDPELPKEVSIEDVRSAQALTGALLWIATRSRPDISFAVSKMGQMATKHQKLPWRSADRCWLT